MAKSSAALRPAPRSSACMSRLKVVDTEAPKSVDPAAVPQPQPLSETELEII